MSEVVAVEFDIVWLYEFVAEAEVLRSVETACAVVTEWSGVDVSIGGHLAAIMTDLC